MQTPFATFLSLGILATILPCALPAALVFSDDFSTDRRADYERVDIWQSSGESAWNIVDGEMRMMTNNSNFAPGTTGFMYGGATLADVGDFAQIDLRFGDSNSDYGRSAGLFLNGTPSASGGLEVRMTIQDGTSSKDRFEVGGSDFYGFTTDTGKEWSTLRIELVSLNGSIATYSIILSGGYNLELLESFQRSGPQYVGFMQYNADGVNVGLDNFEIGVIPEPGTTAFLMGAGALGAGLLLSRRRK